MPRTPYQAVRPDDDEIIKQILAGNINLFEKLVKEYQPYLLSLVRRHVPAGDVVEVTQDAFVRAYKSLKTYKGIGGGFKPWLASIAMKTCHDYWRDRYRSNEVPMSDIAENHLLWMEKVTAEQSAQAQREQGAADEAKELLNWALNKLAPGDRLLVELVYLEELSIRETAELLGLNQANVKVRLFRVRKKMEKILRSLMRDQDRWTQRKKKN